MFYIVILLVLTIIFLFIANKSSSDHKKLPPGPIPWPFVGNQFLIKHLTHKFGAKHIALWELSRQYGSDVIKLKVGNAEYVVVSGNNTIRDLLNNDAFNGRPWNEFIKLRNMGYRKGITMNDGPDWKNIRLWLVSTLKTLGFGKQLMSNLIQNELDTIIQNLKKDRMQNIKAVITPAVINVLWTMATGKPFLQPRLESFIQLMERRSKAFDVGGGLLTFFPWIRYIAPEYSGYNLLIKLNTELKSTFMEVIDDHKKKYVPGNETDLIDMFLQEMNEKGNSNTIFTDIQLILILVDLFIAGSITTTASLDFLFLHMVVYQDVQRKVREEIKKVIGTNKFPELEDRQKLPYTEAVIAEVGRIYPITPMIGPRRVLHDTILNDYTISKNTTVLINTYSVHMDPNLYPEPHLFKPERFFKNGVFKPDENTLNFGKGKRRCPGEVLAKTAQFSLFVGVLQKFALYPVSTEKVPKIEVLNGILCVPKSYELMAVPQ